MAFLENSRDEALSLGEMMLREQERILISSSDWRLTQMSTRAFVIVAALIVGSSCLVPMANADEPTPDMVPAPWVHENHEFNVSYVDGYYVHEGWGIQISHGGSMTALGVRRLNNGPDPTADTFVDYSIYLNYNVSGRQYSAQFYFMELKFHVEETDIQTMLSTCSDFALNRTPVQYDGAVPTIDCNITFHGIRVYSTTPSPPGSEDSTFDLTLMHHIRGDWNDTQVKVEALLDFSKTKFFSPANSTECPAGTPFAAEIDYRIYVTEVVDNHTGDFLKPTSWTNNTLIFDTNQTNGTPLAVSRLDMRDDFIKHNATGDNASIGYSFIGMPNDMFTPVTHTFPNLTYRDTQWMRSDPEVTVYHDMVTEENNQNPWEAGGLGAFDLVQLGSVCAIIAAVAIGTVFFLRMRRKRATEKTRTKPDKP